MDCTYSSSRFARNFIRLHVSGQVSKRLPSFADRRAFCSRLPRSPYVCLKMIVSSVAIVLGCILACASAARFNVVGSQNQEQQIRLKSQYDLEPGKVLKLPIDVPKEYISLFGTAPPRLLRITSPNADGVYGTGDIIYIDLDFTIDVLVDGIPTLTVNTGCDSTDCRTKEVQSFSCAADRGKFAMRLENQFLMNIDVNMTKEELKKRIEEFDGVNRVTITYSDTDDRRFNGGNKVCSSVGNKVTITFDDVNFPQYDGDVPMLLFDATNTFADLRSGLNLGEKDTFLAGVDSHSRRYTPNVTDAIELTKGVQQRDGTAYYYPDWAGSTTNASTVRFKFLARNGDFTERLEVKALRFTEGYIYSPVTFANVSTAVPAPRAGPRYMSQAASALGFRQHIRITSAQPQIISVTSPEADGVYTQGDVLSIFVEYDLAVKVYGAGEIVLELATGAFNRQIPLLGSASPTVLEFQYVVQEGDTSVDLDSTGTAALLLNDGFIYRATSTNETAANITLPFPGKSGSLSFNKNIVINTLSPQIVRVNAVSRTGVYTAGDLIDFEVLYGNPIFVQGTPRLLIENTVVAMDVEIRTAPFRPDVSYTRAQPGEVLQTLLTFSVNWDLNIGDKIWVDMPGFSIRDLAGSGIDRTMIVTSTVTLGDVTATLPCTAVWKGSLSALQITAGAAVARTATIAITVAGQSGLVAPSAGVRPTASGLSFSLVSPDHVDATLVDNLPFDFVSAVGFESLAVSITPPSHGAAVQLTWSFTVPETLISGDEISLFLPGFLVQNTTLLETSEQPVIPVALSPFNFTWYPNASEFRGIVTDDVSTRIHFIRVSDYVSLMLPSEGVSGTTVTVSAAMRNNGNFEHISVPTVSKVCGLALLSEDDQPLPSVSYLTKRTGSASAVRFAWTVGTVGMNAGDSVLFTLPAYDTNLPSTARTIASGLVSSTHAFTTVTVQNAEVRFTLTDAIASGTFVEVTLAAGAGLIVPTTGIRPGVESFSAQIVSTACAMNAQRFYFSEDVLVLPVTSATVAFTPAAPALGEHVAISVQFQVTDTIRTGDAIAVKIPGFARNIRFDAFNVTVTGSVAVDSFYDSYLEELQFTLLADFNIAQVAATFSLDVQRSSGFAVPTSGVPSGAFQLSVTTADSGSAVEIPMTSPCLGFCSGSVVYSTHFASQPVGLTIALSYSDALALNKVLTFDMSGGFILSGSVALTAQVYVNPAMSVSVTPTWNSGALQIALPLAIAQSTVFTIELVGLELTSGATVEDAPSVSTDATTGSTLDGTPSLTLNYPDEVLAAHSLSVAALTFTQTDTVNATILQLDLTNAVGQHLLAGSFVDITLPGFSLSTANLVSADGVVDVATSTWDSPTQVLRLILAEYLAPAATMTVTVTDVHLPPLGVSGDAALSGATYSIGLGSATECITLPVPLTSTQPVVRILYPSVAFTFTPSSSYALDTITVTFTTGSELNIGDEVSFNLPGLSTPGATASLPLVSSTLSGAAMWDESSSNIVLTVSQYQLGGAHVITFNAASGGLVVSTAGIPTATPAVFSITAASVLMATDSTSMLPCAGVCSAAITPTVRKAGFPTELTVDIVLGTHDFVVGDVNTFTLANFIKKGTSSVIVTGLSNAGPVQLNVTMHNGTEELIVDFASTMPSNATFQDVSFAIPQSFALLLPAAGIRSSDLFDVTWASSLRGPAYVYSSNVATVAPVGKLLVASMGVEPRLPGVSAEYAFAFRFTDALAAGDFLRVYLPGFSVPVGLLTLVPDEVLGITATLVDVVGVAAPTERFANVDSTYYQLQHMAYLQINLLEDLAAAQDLVFSIRNSSLLKTPPTGVYRNTVPWVSVSSATSPVTAVQFPTYTAIGSLSPASLAIQSTASGAVSADPQLSADFTINCPLFDGDVVSLYVPNLVLTVGASPSINVTATRNVQMSGLWSAADSVFTLTVTNNTYVLSGFLSIELNIIDFTVTDDVMYENDARITYSVTSVACPVDSLSFDASAASYLRTSSVTFDPLARVSVETPVSLSLTTAVALQVGDLVALTLPGFNLNINGTVSAVTAQHLVSVTGSAALSNSALVLFDADTEEVAVHFKVTTVVTAGTTLSMTLPSTTSLSIIVPAEGVYEAGHEVLLAAYRRTGGAVTGNAAYLLTGTTLVFQGRVKHVQSVRYFLSKAVTLDNPLPGAHSAATLSWVLSEPVPAGSVIEFSLPDFTSDVLSATAATAVDVEGTYGSAVEVTWNPTTSTVKMLALRILPREQEIAISLPIALGFVCPTHGIPFGDTVFSVTLTINDAVALSEDVAEVSVVPFVLASSVRFIDADEDRSYELGGDPYVMQLAPGHRLNSQDAGSQVVISNAFYTIVDIQGNLLYLLEPYHGVRIFMGYPAVPVYTPPYRFADYSSGSTTSSLIFRYRVRRDDLSNSLRVFEPTDLFNTNNASQSIDLNGGQLMRHSDNPALLADIAIPAYITDATRSVNTDQPTMVSFFTTSPTGMYALGQKVDFHVQFDHPVTVGNLSFSVPTLLLKVAEFGRVTARYSSGSGTDTIVFVYAVNEYDDQDHIGSEQISTAAPIFQPLRVITGYQFNSLRRTSDAPLIDADIDFPINSGLHVNFPANISLVGAAVLVEKVWTPFDIVGTNFSAGDAITVMVTFSGPVAIHVADGSLPRILLEVGRSQPGEAFYSSQLNDTTLTFTYEVTLEDELSQGLYLTCTCADYFQRTFIMMNGSDVVAVDSDGDDTNVRASVLLASSPDPSALRIDDPNGNGIRIDRAVPHVLQVSSNLSYHENVAYSPGTVALISVKFNLRVTVRGILRLWLNAQEAPCPARYYSGNNTDVLNFLYMFTAASGISRLEYTDVNALDVQDGVIMRYSDRPQIIADTLLPRPGLQQSLGVVSTNMIDTELIAATAITANEPQNVGEPYFAAHSLSLSLYRLGAGAFQYLSQPERRAVAPLNQLYENSSVQSSLATIERYFNDPLVSAGSEWSAGNANYTRLVLSDSSDEAMSFTPLLRSVASRQALAMDSYWWNDLQIRSTVELELQMSRAAVVEGAFVELNTGKHLNRAYAALSAHSYYLVVTSKGLTALGSEQERYRLSYNGQRTRCISVTADAKSVFSLQVALEEIPALHVLEPNVVRMMTRQEGASVLTYYRIDFVHMPAHALDLISGAALGESCPLPVSLAQVSLLKENATVTFEYDIRGAGAVLFQASSDMPAGTYTVNVDELSGVYVSEDGVEPHSVQLERFAGDGRKISKATVVEGVYVPRIRRSSLTFGSNVPGEETSITVTVCVETAFQLDDKIIVHLANFGTANAALSYAEQLVDGNFRHWAPARSELSIAVTGSAEASCITEVLSEAAGFVLPDSSIHRNSTAFTVSIFGSDSANPTARLEATPFQAVSPVGVSDFSVDLSDQRPTLPTEITLSFVIVPDFVLAPEDTVLTVFLPGAYMTGGFSGALNLGGPLAAYFAAEWVNATNALIVRPLQYIQPRAYSLTVLAGGTQTMHVPAIGMYSTNQPSFTLVSAAWSCAETKIESYPSILGHDASSLSLTMTPDSQAYDVERIVFSAVFSRPIAGPGVITLTLPFLSTRVQKVNLPVDSSLYSSIVWRNWEKTMTITRIAGWNAATVTVDLGNLDVFTLNDLGVPENQTDAGILFAAKGGNGELMPTRIVTVTPVPRIRHAALSVSTIGADIFDAAPQVLTIEMELNTPARTFDFFYFQFKGMSPVNATNAVIDNRCLSLNSTGQYSGNQTIEVYLNNNTNCKHETRFLRWTITELLPSDISLRAIAQYKTEGFTVSWENDLRYTQNVQFNEVPTLGITYSAIELSYPYAGHASEVAIRILTATNLRTGDMVVITLPNFVFSWTSTVLVDNFGRLWPTEFVPATGVMTLTAPMRLPATALLFRLTEEFAAVLPVDGIPAPIDSKFSNNDKSGPGGITIGLRRNDVVIRSQPIQRVTPVGKFTAFDLRPMRMMRYDVVSKSIGSEVKFDISLTTLSPLRAGDVLTIELSQYTFAYDEILRLAPQHDGVLQGQVVAASNQIMIKTMWDVNVTALDIEILSSNAVQVGLGSCDQLTSECPVYVSVLSASNPVNRQTFISKEAFMLANATLKFYETSRDPTPFPTSEPSSQPSGQPSRQPTCQPSAHPSQSPVQHSPTSQPSAQPSVNPTGEPSSQPSISPTTQPSSDPSSVPSSQPSSMPTMPTSQPSSQPSSLPSTQPSSMPTSPTSQPSAMPTMPTSQPSSMPTMPTSLPSAEPSAQPWSEPTSQPSKEPTSHPSGQPTAQPFGDPTGQPSSHPTRQPSRQPTGQPSTHPTSQPSGQPTMMPTMFGKDFDVIMELSFTLQNSLSQGAILAVNVPNVYSNLTANYSTAIEIVQQYVTIQENWGVIWHEPNQTFRIVALVDIAPGEYFIQLYSSQVQLDSKIMYENDPHISYALEPFPMRYDSDNLTAHYFPQSGQFGKVFSYGLKNSSLSLSNLLAGEVTSVIVVLEADNTFRGGDKVFIDLPGFELWDNISSLTALTNNAVTLGWDPLNSTVSINVQATTAVLNVELRWLRSATAGFNEFTNTPMIRYFNSATYRHFASTPLLRYTAVAHRPSVDVAFSSALAGQVSDIVVTVSTPLYLDAYDVISLYLPQFWSTQAALTVTSPDADFTATWDVASESIRVRVPEELDLAGLTLTIAGLRLPLDGVNEDLQRLVSLTSNSTRGGRIVKGDTSVQLVGYVMDSFLQLEPAEFSAPVELTLGFALSIPLKVGEMVTFQLPGFTIGTAAPTLQSSNDGEFAGDWDQATHTLKLNATRRVLPALTYTVVLDDPVTLPAEGIFADNRRDAISPVVYELGVDTAVAGIIDPTEIHTVQYVGLTNVHVDYDTVRDALDDVAVRLAFRCTATVAVGDEIRFYAPLLSAPAATGATASLDLAGDLAEESFAAPFTGSFVVATQTIVLTATEEVVSRDMSVFVTRDSGLKFTTIAAGYAAAVHTVSADIAEFGTVAARSIAHSPKNFFAAQPGALNITSCVDETVAGCAFSFAFDLLSELKAGESLSLSHPSLRRSLNPALPANVSSVTSLVLNISGDAASYLTAHWRPADDVSRLSLTSNRLSLIDDAFPSVGAHSDAAALADISWYGVNHTIPQDALAERIAVISRIPQVQRVYALHRHSQGVSLACGDTIEIVVQFTEPIIVKEPQYLRLLLNTAETAAYKNGNESDSLVFTYRVTSPLDVSSLEILGPGALEFSFSAPSRILQQRASSLGLTIPANLTIPAPYGPLLLVNGAHVPLAVECDARPVVTEVVAYSKQQATYATGDILDVEVRFDREITVSGVPALLLSNVSGDTQFLARYVNISKIQWLDLPTDGFYSLSYGDERTSCMRTTNTSGLLLELAKLTGLTYALPVTLQSFAVPDGLRYRVQFAGVPPFVFRQDPLTCPDDEIVAGIRADPSVLRSAFFRYEVVEGDEASMLSYGNSTALRLTPGSSVYTAGSTSQRAVDTTLPDPDGPAGLLATSEVRIHTAQPYVISVTSTSGGSVLTSGEVVDITVTFSAPVTVTGQIELELDGLNNTLSKTCCTARVTSHSAVGSEVSFSYTVQMGDHALYLGTSAANLRLLTGASVVLLTSIRPSTTALLALPASNDANGLEASLVEIAATTLPIVLSVFTNHTRGSFNAGERIFITIRFSADIAVLPTVANVAPSIALLTPSGAEMTYAEGSGGRDIVFLYTVSAGESTTNNVTFELDLLGGLFRDPYLRTFANLASSNGVIYDVGGIQIDTVSPTVVRLDSLNANGTYYPGDILDVYIVFSEPVLILGGGLQPSLELFLPSQLGINLLAQYSFGNGTNEIHFTYLVPPPNIRMDPQSLVRLDYAGVDALVKHMNGTRFTDVSSSPTTEVNVFLPSTDNSNLGNHRQIYIDFTFAEVVGVTALSADGIYTAGDEVLINVQFSSRVMVFVPPVLKLATGSFNRSAVYVSGNFTHALVFRYTVQLQDISPRLDYVDTRAVPYRSQTRTASFALNTEVENSLELVTDTVTTLFLLPTDFGGVFMASQSEESRVPAYTSLALPGTPRSLASAAAIVIDTTAPFITKVTVPIASGTYNSGVSIPITMEFNAAVVVRGCPKILFQINGIDKYAQYIDGSGTTVLNFKYVVQTVDAVFSFDYLDRFSLRLEACNISQAATETSGSNPTVAILRNSLHPQVHANLTMPWVNYVESVAAPVSITGSGKDVNIFGSANAPRMVWTGLEDVRSYALGDVIDINLGFTSEVLFPDRVYLQVTDSTAAAVDVDHTRSTYFGAQLNETTVTFPLVVQHQESIGAVSYRDQFSLITDSSCAILDVPSRDCTAQNLPVPFAHTPANAIDALSPKSLQIERPIVAVELLHFANATPGTPLTLRTGSVVSITVDFSDPVMVQGTPFINMYLESVVFPVFYQRMLTPSRLLFQANLDTVRYGGKLVCSKQSDIDLNGGSILRAANFLPMLKAELEIAAICCLERCEVFAHVLPSRPSVLRVYSPQNGVLSTGERIDLFVDFSMPLTVIGTPALVLDLPGYASATYVALSADRTTLSFSYLPRVEDFTSALDYAGTDALKVDVGGLYDGIYLHTSVGNITAILTLPPRGSRGSLGWETNVVINKDRPNLVTALALPARATSGDDLRIILRYTEAMAAVDSAGEDVFLSGALEAGTVSLGMQIILQPTVVTASNPPQARVARLSEVDGADVIFIYEVTAADPSGSVLLSSVRPLVSNNVLIRSANSGTVGPVEFSTAVASASLATIDNNFPTVVRVYSSNQASLYPFGVGDVIEIYVEMSLDVIVAVTPTLQMLLNNGVTGIATYVPNGQPFVRTLHFQYVVRVGDSADPLEYNGRFALTGKLLRFSTRNAAIVADLELPEPAGLGSLGYCCYVVIDSEPPFIESLLPIKRAGIYGEAEIIYIMARFSKPVVVQGVPLLRLTVNSESNSMNVSAIGWATYVSEVTEYDIPINIQSTDVMFKYVVQRYDNVISLHHHDEASIVLPAGATIIHKTNSPTLAADITLRDPDDHAVVNGRVYRQWKFRYPATVEILLRDLYHTKADSLKVVVDHVGSINTLFSGACAGKTFGHSYPKTRSGTNSTLLNVDTGIGSDFLFSDITAPNIAASGIVTQSSTRLSAKLAIDGNVDPLVGDGSVSETTEEDDAWWQVLLPANSLVRALTIWSRKPQNWINPITELVIKSFNSYPEGRYRLLIQNINENNPDEEVTTGYIDFGASALAMQRIIEATPGLGNVAVTRRTLPLCAAIGRGCGDNYESGFGFAYRLSFLSIFAPTPNVTVVSIRFPGQADNLEESVNAEVRRFPIYTVVELIRAGFYIQVPEKSEYGLGVVPPVTNETVESGDRNAWLTPFWVFLFDGVVPPRSLNESVNASIWSQRFESMGNLLNINLPEALSVSYVKIQREGYGSLSLAELEVYEEKINELNSYVQGSPVHASPLSAPYQPTQSFKHTFNQLQFDGRWLVQLTQDATLQRDVAGWSGAVGTISEAVLIITDLAGVVHSYYQDLRAEVTALPKYGDLMYTVPYTPSPYGNWRERFEVTEAGQLIPKPGGERHLGFCYGPDTYSEVRTQDPDNTFQVCPDNFGVGPQLSPRVLGDTPTPVFLRNERVVVYKPREGYLGPDYFTYVVHDGQNQQTHEFAGGVQDSRNEVTVHVRKCRPFQNRILRGVNATVSSSFEADGTHILCQCAQTETSPINNRTMCDAARTTVCASLASGGDAVASREHFLALCLICTDPRRGLSSAECQTQTIRAVSLLTSRGLCVPTSSKTAAPFMDCSTETVTEPGREATNYLSVRPPMLAGSFQKLKDSFGAYGWYHTPLLT